MRCFFTLAAAILLDLIGQDEAVHGQGGKDIADIDERENVSEQLHGQCGCNWQDGDEKSEKDLAGKPLPALDRPHERKQQGSNDRHQRKRVQGAAEILIVRCDIDETVDERETDKQDNIDCQQAKHGIKKLA